MKYTNTNKPIVCMMTNSSCYKGTEKMTIKGILWHSTGANNPSLKRYVQPSENDPNYNNLIKLIGENKYHNDWNHINNKAGLNAWVGKLADGTVASIQTMPWDYRPWGCGKGSKGSCNDGWIQFEICEDNLKNEEYFNAVYKEACEITAYLCKMYNIDPKGTVKHNGVVVPTILCHKDSANLKLGSNHSDVLHWFKKYNKSMDNVREDVQNLLEGKEIGKKVDVIYQSWDDKKNRWLNNITNDTDYSGNMGNAICAIRAHLTSGDCVYRVHTLGGKWSKEITNRNPYAGTFNKPIDAFMIKSKNKKIKIRY